jgi:hypothetical protein
MELPERHSLPLPAIRLAVGECRMAPADQYRRLFTQTSETPPSLAQIGCLVERPPHRWQATLRALPPSDECPCALPVTPGTSGASSTG